jgi:hypothetical protein
MIGKQVFISYAKEDSEIATKIYYDLKRAGVKAWLDSKDLLPGQNWKLTIREAINESSYFLALLSSNSVSKKGFIQKELKMALDITDELPKTEIFILPARIDDCKPIDESLQDLHWCDLFPNYDAGIETITRVVAPLIDLDFENFEKGIPQYMSKGIGAYNGSSNIESKVEQDFNVRYEDKPSLKLSGDEKTHKWIFLSYKIPRFVKRLHIEFAVKTENVRKEGTQFNNCYVGFMYRDEFDNKQFNTLQFDGTNEWSKHYIDFDIEETHAHNIEFGIFLSKSGTMWVNGIKFKENGF